jgi:Transposase IS4
LRVWKPGRDLVVDKIIVRFKGQLKETTTIPNKPTPTGYKIWKAAQRGFLLVWKWHIPGQKNGPIELYTSRELGGTIKAGNSGNKIQVVVLHLIKRLPKPPKWSGYYVYLNNLFISTRFIQYARSQEVVITGIYRITSRVIQELLNLQKSDRKDVIPWGEIYSRYTSNREVYYVR